MPRVVGTDPGSSSLDLLLLVDGLVADQARLLPEQLRSDASALLSLIDRWKPIDLIAGPSGYGLPLIRGTELTENDLAAMSLVRDEERDRDVGVGGFRKWVRALCSSGERVVFLPGGIHLPTIPAHRKANTIDMGTPDKIAVAALAVWADRTAFGHDAAESTFAVVEIGSVFSAVLVVEGGRIVDASAGTRGPIGVRSRGAWDGEAAYLRCPLTKNDLFRGGLDDLGALGPAAFRESLTRHVAGLQAVTRFERLYISGISADRPEIASLATEALAKLGSLYPLPSLSNAWVKHAAQGSALLADGLAGGPFAWLVDSLALQGAAGSALSYLR